MIRTRVAEHRLGGLVAACLLILGLISMATPMAAAAPSPTVITPGTPTLQAAGAAVAMPLTVTCPTGNFLGPFTLSQSSGGAVLSQSMSLNVLCDGTAHKSLAVAVGEGFGLTRPWHTGPALLLIGGVPQSQQLKKVTIGTGKAVQPSPGPRLVVPSSIGQVANGLTLKVPTRIRCPHGQFAEVNVMVEERIAARIVQGAFGQTVPLCTGAWQQTVVPVDTSHLPWVSGRSLWLDVDMFTDSVDGSAQGAVMVK